MYYQTPTYYKYSVIGLQTRHAAIGQPCITPHQRANAEGIYRQMINYFDHGCQQTFPDQMQLS